MSRSSAPIRYGHDPEVVRGNVRALSEVMPYPNACGVALNRGREYLLGHGVPRRHLTPHLRRRTDGHLAVGSYEVSAADHDAPLVRARSAEAAIYYDTVHWVKSAMKSPADGRTWYQVLDDKWKVLYYAPGEHLRLIPEADLAPLSPDVPNEEKRIEVHLDDQYLVAFEYGTPIFTTRVATGAVLRVGTYHTPRGSFLTYHKRPTRHMAAGDITASGFDLPGVPWVMYFTESGISLHGTCWHNDYGRPRSHGCINLTPGAARWLYRWTLPIVPAG